MTLPATRPASLSILFLAACSASPLQDEPDPAAELLRESVIEALDYWSTTAGITYELIEDDIEPRLLIRPGTDGLAPQGGGRAVVDGTYPDNRVRSGLVVFEPFGGTWCNDTAACRYLHRHEIGHTLGFLDHSAAGLMASGPPELTDRELRMITALYSLPHGAVVQSDGRWSVPPAGPNGILDDVQAAQDIIAWNMNAIGGSSYRASGVITRWELPVRVLLRE